jgi:hypothetical protein
MITTSTLYVYSLPSRNEDSFYSHSGKCKIMSNVGETAARWDLIRPKVCTVPQLHSRVHLSLTPLAHTRSMKKHQSLITLELSNTNVKQHFRNECGTKQNFCDTNIKATNGKGFDLAQSFFLLVNDNTNFVWACVLSCHEANVNFSYGSSWRIIKINCNNTFLQKRRVSSFVHQKFHELKYFKTSY